MWRMRWPALLACLLALAAPAARAADMPATLRAALAGEEVPDPGSIRAWFSQGRPTLDLFCKADGNCQAARHKAELYKLFFRGAFAAAPTGARRGSDPDAAYAYHAARYFTEQAYACRHPLTARVLETLWQLPSTGQRCGESVPFMLTGDDGQVTLRKVDPSRVAAVHLLFAGESGRTLSAFGHVGLRLVVCADSRSQVDEQCDQDLHDHIAVGFRAAVDELDISVWKGLTGGYDVRLYADPFMRAYEEYTIQESRSLSSLPLDLPAGSRELMVRALAEVHWAYRNDYRFFTQNCASELSWLLRVVGQVSGADKAWLDGGNVRPDRLFRRARASAAFRGDVLDDLQKAERGGHYFPSSEPYYQVALDTVAARLDVSPVPLQSFRELDAARRRSTYYEPALAATGDVSADATRPAPARAAHAALVLEAWHEKRLRRELMAAFARRYRELAGALLANTGFFDDAERTAIDQCMSGFTRLDELGYSAEGVPRAPTVPTSTCPLAAPALRAAIDKLFALSPLTGRDRAKLAELQATVDTVNWLAPQTQLPAFQ